MYNRSGFPTTQSSYGVLADPSRKYSTRKVPSSIVRCVATIMGVRVEVIKATIVLYAQGVANTAEITIGSEGNADFSDLLKDVGNDGTVVVEVRAGFTTDARGGTELFPQLQSVFLGILNKFSWKTSGFESTFTCTSLATLLMVSKQTSLYQGMTTVDFIKRIAADTGLESNVMLRSNEKPLSLRAVFAEDFVVGVHNVAMWKMANICSQADDVFLFLSGYTLNYVAPSLEQPRKHFVLIHGGGYLTDAEGDQSPQFARNIHVEIRTFSRHTTTSYVSHVEPGGDGSAVIDKTTRTITPDFGTKNSSSTTQKDGQLSRSSYSVNQGGFYNSGDATISKGTTNEPYIEHIPNLTPDECDRRALNEWRRLSRKERRMVFTFPITPENIGIVDPMSVIEYYESPHTGYNSNPKAPAYFQQRLTLDIDPKNGWVAKAETVNHVLAIENSGTGGL